MTHFDILSKEGEQFAREFGRTLKEAEQNLRKYGVNPIEYLDELLEEEDENSEYYPIQFNKGERKNWALKIQRVMHYYNQFTISDNQVEEYVTELA